MSFWMVDLHCPALYGDGGIGLRSRLLSVFSFNSSPIRPRLEHPTFATRSVEHPFQFWVVPGSL